MNAANRILSALGYTESELSVLIVDDIEMARLNLEYRQIGHTTDVLSFPMLEGEFSEVAPEMLGDIVISADTAAAMSDQTGASLDSILHLLLIHGVLHLLGFDHEAEESEAALMKQKTEEILSILGHSGAEFAWYYEDSD